MSGPFVYEIASVAAAVQRTKPGDPKGAYALPWYLVIGEPGSGRSTALRSMNLTWQGAEAPLRLNVPQQHCTYWMPAEAVFIEPEQTVLGPQRDPHKIRDLCDELRAQRPREPIDGILLLLSIADFVDLDERGVEAYGSRLRGYLVEVGRRLHADVPVYVALMRYDTMWGFAEVFQWTPERKGEEPWGFTLPPDTPSDKATPRIATELDGLGARFEGFCLAKLSSEDPPEHRTRAFQHLAEVRALMVKVRALLGVLAMANAFERAPWLRALTIGSAVPGTGDRLRAGVARFANMGLAQAAPAAVGRPGGLPIHAFMKTVVLPEKDLVPLRMRWRDDKLIIGSFIAGGVLWLATVVVAIVLAIVR